MHDFTADPISVEIIGGSSAPWWGVPVIAGGFLLLGAVLGYFLNRAHDNRKAERDRIQRWDDRLLELVSEVFQAFEKFCSVAIETGRQVDGRKQLRIDGLIPESESPELEDLHSTATVSSAFIELAKACTELELIAPSPIREAAEPMRTFTIAKVHPAGYEAMAEQVMRLDDQKKILEAAVRKHLGIK